MADRPKLLVIGIMFRIKIALVSCLLGALVVLPFILIFHWDAKVVLARSMAIALFNGIVGPFFLTFILYRNIRSKTFWSLLAVFIYIGVVSSGSALFFGLRDRFLLITIVVWAETVGLVAAYLIARYTIRLNEKLAQTQQRLRNSRKS